MPNIENFRKQAKLYLRWHRDGYHPVAAQIRSTLARYNHLSDRQVLEHGFKLSDAQELVARKSGFDSWQALKQGIDAMTDATTQTIGKPILQAAEPQLFVADMQASCDFYEQKLAFQIAFVYGTPPFYAQVFRDGARLNLRHVDGPVFDSQFRSSERDALSATITLDDAKPLFLEFQAAGVTFHQALKTEPWGVRTFIVRDPDGNLIAFSGRAASTPGASA
jgi:catechol 2,3-dioxygenase-like lactoylglutathione lyase family enzyme